MTSEDIELCLVTFVAHDTLKQGLVRVCDLAAILESYTGETPRSEEVFEMTCDADVATDSSEENAINFGEFMRLMTARKKRQQAVSDDDLLEAYVACGGDEDGGGCVNADILVRVIKEDFQLAIDIKELIMAVDEDGSGEIEFDEFKSLLSTALSLNGDADGDDD